MSSQSRDRVPGVLSSFKCRLRLAGTIDDARRLADESAVSLVTVQGTPSHRTLLTWSVCQMAASLRRPKQSTVAIEGLDRAGRRGAMDAYSSCEFAACHLCRGDVESALKTLLDACEMGAASESLNKSLAKIYVIGAEPQRVGDRAGSRDLAALTGAAQTLVNADSGRPSNKSSFLRW
jgi:hypothetical protein